MSARLHEDRSSSRRSRLHADAVHARADGQGFATISQRTEQACKRNIWHTTRTGPSSGALAATYARVAHMMTAFPVAWALCAPLWLKETSFSD